MCRLAAINPRLARLRLSRAGLCGVTSAGRGRRSLTGPRSLALTLKAAPQRLVVLDLSRSFVDDAAAQAIAHGGLEHNRVLTNLIISGNSIGGEVKSRAREGEWGDRERDGEKGCDFSGNSVRFLRGLGFHKTA